MKWIITGGCGFIGKNLVKRLLKDGFQDIRVIDNLSVGTSYDLENDSGFKLLDLTNDIKPVNGLDIVVGDILDKDIAISATEGANIIIHLAANCGVEASIKNPIFDCDNNINGTLNYLEAARLNNISRFVFASSGAPAGNIDPPIHEEIVPKPISPYGASKLACEGYCSAYKHSFGLDTVVLRFSNVYGPLSRHKNSVVAKFIREILEEKSLETYGDGNQTRDFIFVEDLVNAIMLASQKTKIGGEVFQIATNKETTINDIIEMLQSIFTEKQAIDITVNRGKTRLGDMKRNYSDISKANNILNWKPRVDLIEGLNKTVNFFIKPQKNG